MSAVRILVTPSTVCRVGQRYAVTIVSRDGSPMCHVDAVGRESAVRAAIASARWTRRATSAFLRGADIR